MKIYIKNLYRIKDGRKAYYQSRTNCKDTFAFVPCSKYATEFTEEEAKEILKHEEYYKKLYGADEMGIEK